MFRQTLMRAAQSRHLQAGATNVSTDKGLVHFTLTGSQAKIAEIVTFMQSGQPLNSWGAVVTSLQPIDNPTSLSHYQVTTANVDRFRWNPSVSMFL
jgi:hypothetical protein